MTMIKKYSVCGQKILEIDPTYPTLVANSVNAVECDFGLSPEWDGLAITAIFGYFGANGAKTMSVLMSGSTCTVPWEALAQPGTLGVGLVGVRDGYTLTTGIVGTPIYDSAYVPGGSIPTPSADVYAQIITTMQTLIDGSVADRERSEAAANSAATAQQIAQTAVQGFDAHAAAKQAEVDAGAALAIDAASSAVALKNSAAAALESKATAEAAAQASASADIAAEAAKAEAIKQAAAALVSKTAAETAKTAAGKSALEAAASKAAADTAKSAAEAAKSEAGKQADLATQAAQTAGTEAANLAAAQVISQSANTFAAALKGTESGEMVTLHGDIGSDMHVTVAGVTPFASTADSPSPEKPIAITGIGTDGSIPVFAGNTNLLENALVSKTESGVTFTVNADKSVSMTGTATARIYFNFQSDIPWKVGTYTINAWSNSAVGLTAQSKLLPQLIVTSSRGAAATIITRPGERINFFLNIPDGAVVNTTIYPTVNLGAVSLPYEPFVQSTTQLRIQSPLYQIGNVRDTVEVCVKSNNGLYIQCETHRLHKIVLDGTEIWTRAADGDYRYSIKNKHPDGAGIPCIGSHYPGTYSYGSYCLFVYTGSGYNVISLGKQAAAEYADPAAWQAYLAAQYAAGTPVTVLYQLAVPEVYASEPQPIPVTQNITTVHSLGPVTVNYNKNLTYAIAQIVAAQIALAAQK